MRNNIALTFVGDVCPADMVFTKGFGIKSKFEKNVEVLDWVKHLRLILQDSDISFCNLEAPLIDSSKFDDNYHFAGTLEFADFLKDCGFDIVSIANNHILEEGELGFNSTLKQLEKTKIKYIGKCENGISNIEIVTTKKKTIGFVAFNAVDLDKINNPNLFAEFSEKYIFSAVEKLKELDVDFKIFSFHWGNEYINIPSDYQKEVAHKLIDLGVNIIVGHHSHVIQPVEEYKGGIIIYSLGNCFFDSIASKNTGHGLCVRVIIDENGNFTYRPINLKISQKGVKIDNSFTAKRRLSLITQKYNSLKNKNDYRQIYLKKLKRKRTEERINMKLLLLKRVLFGDIKYKRMLINNIFGFYFHSSIFIKKRKS